MTTRRLSCGVDMSVSDLIVLVDHSRAAVPSRSLFVMLNLREGAQGHSYGDKPCVCRYGEVERVAATDARALERSYSCGERVRGVVLQARPEVIGDDALSELIDDALRCPGSVPSTQHAHLASLAEELLAQPDRGPLFGVLAESCGLELMFRSLADAERMSQPQRRDVAALNRVRDAIIADPGADHTLQALALGAGLSVSTLKAGFPQIFGMPVFAFLRDTRMRRARDGLERDGWSVKQAAGFVGYAHASNFARRYRRHFGHAPGQARK